MGKLDAWYGVWNFSLALERLVYEVDVHRDRERERERERVCVNNVYNIRFINCFMKRLSI